VETAIAEEKKEIERSNFLNQLFNVELRNCPSRYITVSTKPVVVILCEDRNIVARIGRLEKVRDKEYTLSASGAGKKDFIIRLEQTGEGLFSTRFESELLHSRVYSSTKGHVPDEERDFWCKLYQKIVHERACQEDQEFRVSMMKKLINRTGSIPKRWQ
jgi:hypothetical protein